MKKKVVLSVAVVLLVVMVAVMCAACTPSVDSVESKFNKKDYKTVTKTENSLSLTKFSDGLVPVPQSAIAIVWYENEEKAKEAYDIAVKLPGASEKTVKRKGKAVATGDEAALKIF